MESSTIQITNLDTKVTTEQLEDIFSEFGPLKRCFTVKPKKKNATHTKGIVQFAISEDVDKLIQDTNGDFKDEIQNIQFKFSRIPDEKQKSNDNPVVDQRAFDRKVALEKKARLIIRNLSFKATDDKLKSHFTTYGNVVDVNILKKKDGKMVGCAFVQYSNVAEASKAIKELNGKPFLQRPVAIDWAVSKDRFQTENSKPAQPEIKEEEAETEKDIEEDMETNDAEDSEDSDGNDEKDDNPMPSDDPDCDSGSDDEDDNPLPSDDPDCDSGSDDESGSDDKSDEEKEAKPERKFGESEEDWRKKNWPKKGHDVSENKTVFVRNLSFNSEEHELKDMMEKNFGKVIFAKFVIDRATERPKGTAFVKFASEESANKCIAESVLTGANSAKGHGIQLDNRPIFVSMALKPEDVREKQVENKTVKEDKIKKDARNLFLSREGLVREGTQAAIGVSKEDLQIRTQGEKRKKDMLKDLNRFISSTRLVIRNLPPNLDEPKLKKLIYKFATVKLKMTELKIMKDLKTGKSKGFAFATFAEDEMAISTLRALNNNPEVFTNNQRPILEFSIENRKALNARQKRLEKSREKNPNFNQGNTNETEIGGKKTGKFALKNMKNKEKKNRPKEVAETNGTEEKEEVKSKFMGSQSKVGQTAMPTHTGPKIRHKGPKISRKEIKKREKDMKNPKKRKAIKESFQNPNGTFDQVKPDKIVSNPIGKAEKKAKKPKSHERKKPKTVSQIKDIREDKNFNKMVTDHKQKMMAGFTKGKKTKQWFDE